MGKKDEEKLQSVLHLLKKQAPLTLKQEKFCSSACVERFLKAEGDSVKKAAKHLRNCLSWRDSFGTDHLMADELSAELAEGMAYVAGHDEELRPVMIFRIKQDYQKIRSQKQFTRLLVFTLEVAIQTMAKNVEQFVLLFDASLFRSASAFMNILVAILKIVADYYPQRLHKAFVIDPPSLFSYLWKGVRPFVELSALTITISSLDFEESSSKFDDWSSYSQASSLRLNPSSMSSGNKLGSCSSSRFAFTVSNHFDSLKPWYLSLKNVSRPKLDQATLYGPKISPLNARSFSFASPIDRTQHANIRKGFFPSTPMPQKTQNLNSSTIQHSTTPKFSFLQSPALFFRKDCQISKGERTHESFVPFLKFYRLPYDEMVYRSKMKPPLGGLISIVAPQLINRRHMSVSQRF